MRTRDKEQSMASIDTQDLLASLQSALGGKGATAGAQTEGGTGNSEGAGCGHEPHDGDGGASATQQDRLRYCEDLLNS